MKTVRKTSTKGYRSDSPDRNNPFNVIKSGNISMKGVPHPVVGFDNTGAVKFMRPGGEYRFPGDTVLEIPMYQDSGVLPPPVSPSLIAPPPREDKLTQDERSYFEMGADILRGLAQPLSYMREISEGNYVPTQVELESEGINPMDAVIALANPADHIYASLAEQGLISDPNYQRDDNLTTGSPGLLGLVAGSAPTRVAKVAEDTFDLVKGARNLDNPNASTIQALNLSKESRRPSNVFEPTANVSRQPQNIVGDVVMAPDATQEGVEFTRRFYDDPQTQQALRKQYFPGGYSVDEARDAASKLDVIDRVRSDVLGRLAGESGLIDGKTWEREIRKGVEAAGITMDDFYRAYPSLPVNDIYRVDPYGPDFSSFPEGTELEFMFQRGAGAPRMQLDPVRADGAQGIYDWKNDQIIGNPDEIRRLGAQEQRRLGAHEAGHYASFRAISDPTSKLGKSYRKNLSEITRPEVKPYISGELRWDQVDVNPAATQAQKTYAYLSDPTEIATRAIELRNAMSEILLTPKYSSLPRESMRDILMGDFSSIGGGKGFQELMADMKSKNIELPEEEFFNIFVGQGNGSSGFDNQKVDSISKLLKTSFVIGGAAAGYGAMQNEGQTSGSMYAGGKIKLKKKETPGFGLIKGRS